MYLSMKRGEMVHLNPSLEKNNKKRGIVRDDLIHEQSFSFCSLENIPSWHEPE
jgi:hypothetical protein